MILIPSCGVTFLDPTFAEHLHTFDVGPVGVGVIFSINVLFYSLTLAFFSKLLAYGARSFWITIGGFITCSSFFLLGPEQSLGLPRQLWIICLGCIIYGIGSALVLGPAMPEFLNLGLLVYPNDKEALGDMASGIYSSCWSLGEFIGPVLGGLLNDNVGFESGASGFAVAGLVYLVIYLTLGESYRSFVKKKENNVHQPLIDGKNQNEILKVPTKHLEIQGSDL